MEEDVIPIDIEAAARNQPPLGRRSKTDSGAPSGGDSTGLDEDEAVDQIYDIVDAVVSRTDDPAIPASTVRA
ncbi:hypothetical protein HK101_000850, partial [Irineochytrium annulatum]